MLGNAGKFIFERTVKLGGDLLKGAGKLGKSAIKNSRAAIAGGAGGFFGGLLSGATGGKLGGEASNSNAGNGPNSTRGGIGSGSSFFGFSTSSNTRVNGPEATKDNCCCCDQTLSLLSSIDETLKRSLYVSQRLGLQNSEMLAENAGNQNIAGLGGSREAASDSAEEVGFNLGKTILSSLALFVAGNAGKIFDPNRNEDGGFNPLGGAVGALAGGFLGGKRKIVNAAIGGVVGSDAVPIVADGFYKAKSEEGMIGGTAGGILGGIASGAATGAAAGLVMGPIGSAIAGIIGGIVGGILFEDAGEAIGDSIAGKFNKEVDSKKIGKDAASEFNKNARGKRNPAFSPMTPGAGVLQEKYQPKNIDGIESYMQTVATREGEVSGGAPHDLSRSSASGRYGFLNQFNSENPEKLGTWDENLIKVMPETAKLTPEQRFNMMKDPAIEDKVMKRFTEDNISSLKKGLGKTMITWEQVDLAHLLGSAGAINFIKAYENNPNTLARNVLSADVINSNPELTDGSLQDFLNARAKISGQMAGFVGGNTKVSAVSPLPAAPSVAAASPVASPIPLITPKTNTGQIDYFAVNNQPSKFPAPSGQGTVLLPTPAPTMQPQKSPNVPYPVDGPRLPMAAVQFWVQGGWARSM